MKRKEIINSNISDHTKFRLNEINEIKDYFNSEIQAGKAMSKKLGKYIAAFDNKNKNLIVLSAASGGVSIIPFASVIGVIFKCLQVLLLVQGLLLCFL